MIQKPKGTYEIEGITGKKVLYLQGILETLMEKYNYEYMRTPLFEATELFHRSVGEVTDIVSKETYDFLDRGNREMTLRPEGTAGIVRSFIENKMYGRSNIPVKGWYYGPMYRYERPQAGRYREFYQFGVEVFGSNDPMVDAEVISIPVNFYKLIGLKGIKVNINSLGDSDSRKNYRESLINYFLPYLNDLCEDCKKRYETNPLRILDCKVDMNKDYMNNVPKITDYLNDESKNHFNKLCIYLDSLDIEYTVNPNLVRGLDYYTNTVFEVEADIEGFGSNNVLCGGGRYNNLVKSLDGPDTPAVGFALGMERLLSAIECEGVKLNIEDKVDVYVIPMNDDVKAYTINLVNVLRLSGFNADTDYMDRNLKSSFKQADRINSKYIIIVGEDEVRTNVLTVKNNQTKEEMKIELAYIVDFLEENTDEHECNCGDDCECGDDCTDGCNKED